MRGPPPLARHAALQPALPTHQPCPLPCLSPCNLCSLNIVHCDLKPENILLRERGRMGVKVSGASCLLKCDPPCGVEA